MFPNNVITRVGRMRLTKRHMCVSVLQALQRNADVVYTAKPCCGQTDGRTDGQRREEWTDRQLT